MKHIVLTLTIMLASAASYIGKAQTNLQFLYDFGEDRQHFTVTVEGFYADSWGDTFFFIDQDLNNAAPGVLTYSPGSSYFEIARNINFWQHLAIAPLSLKLEYNGGHSVGQSYQNAFLAGIDLALFRDNEDVDLSFNLLFKYIDYVDDEAFSDVPLQLGTSWSIRNLFGLKGLEFCGFADFWWEDQTLLFDHFGEMLPEESSVAFISEPQLWYNIGSLLGCKQLSIGGEVELSYNHGLKKGFWCRPCAGLKWVF